MQRLNGIYHWTQTEKTIGRRGAGAMRPVGGGEGLGVHLLTGPVAIDGAELGDVLEVRILDVAPRPSSNPLFAGRTFGSNAAASWGYHYTDLIEEPKPREVITIYELDTAGEPFASAAYSYVWTPQTDPHGVVHAQIDYPGVVVDHSTIQKRESVLAGIRVPGAAAFRHDGARAGRGRLRQLGAAELHRWQHRRLAHRQGQPDVLPGGRARGIFLGRRSARGAGRQRIVRHCDRDVADR